MPAMNKVGGKWFCDEHYDDMLELEEQFEEHANDVEKLEQ